MPPWNNDNDHNLVETEGDNYRCSKCDRLATSEKKFYKMPCRPIGEEP